MKMRELEIKINEKVAELKLNTKEKQTYYEDLARQVLNIVRDIVKLELFGQRSENIYVTTYKGNVVVKTYFNYNDIVIKVKRTKGDKVYNYGSTQYYYINKVEVDYYNMNETIDKWYATNKRLDDEKHQEDTDKMNTFIKFLQDKNMTAEEFELYDNIYRKYKYKIMKLLEKE